MTNDGGLAGRPVPRAGARAAGRGRALLAAGATALALCVVAAACGGGGSDAKSPTSTDPGASTAAPAGGGGAAGVIATTVAPTSSSQGTTSTAASTTTSTTAKPVTHAPCKVSYIGDSLGTGTLDNGLPRALTNVGCQLVWNTAYGGMETAVGAQLLAKASGQPTNVALVMLGYHNATSENRKGLFPGYIDSMMQAAGKRLVVWPLLSPTADCSPWYKTALTTANKALQAATTRYPNLALADYPTFVTPHPEYSQHRCPHLLPPGYAATAVWLAGEVRRLVDASAAANP